MRLLISPQSINEAVECVKGNADIIDVKNPSEGSLGANFPWIIRSIRKMAPRTTPISATVGDIAYQPGTVALASLGAATAGASFVKVGLYDIKTIEQGIEVMKAVKRTIEEYQLPVSIVVAGYAEGEGIGSLDPLTIPQIAAKAKCDYAMLDTFDKTTKKPIFDILSNSDLEDFITLSREKNISVALGGSIKINHIPILKKLQPDIVGIRGAVCDGGDREKGTIRSDLINEFSQKLAENE